MLIKSNQFFRKQIKTRQKSLWLMQMRRENCQKKSISNSKLCDFLKIDSISKRRNKSSSIFQKGPQQYHTQEKEIPKCSLATKQPSLSKQTRLPLKINKLIINNQTPNVLEKNSSKQAIQPSSSKNRLSIDSTQQKCEFLKYQMFEQKLQQQISELKDIHILCSKQNVFYQTGELLAQQSAIKKKNALMIKHEKQDCRQRLAIRKKEIEYEFFTIQSQNYARKIKDLQDTIQGLQKNKILLEINLQSFEKVYREIQIEHKIKTEELSHYEIKLVEVLNSLESKSSDLETICRQIEQNSKNLSSIQQRGKQIYNFVNSQQKRKILHEVSQDYKKREGDMYDYALQMQTNTWATGLKELKPFTEQEKYLEQRISSLCRELSCDSKAVPFEKKCSEIKDFLFKMYASFKRMNDDMRTINDFKTKCIREFVTRMQKWLQNWELKQEFLVNLRQEFVLDEIKLNQTIQALQSSLTLQGFTHAQAEKLKQIKLSAQKLTENYKLGNSFY